MNRWTSRKRVRAAMRHEPPDRVPVMCQLALGHYFLHSGFDPADIWFDSPTFAQALETLRSRYGFDGLLINLPGRPADWRDYLADEKRDEADSYAAPEGPSRQIGPVPLFAGQDGRRLRWTNGLETRIPPDDNPQTYAPGGGTLPRADYRSVDADDPAIYRLPGYVWNTWHAPGLWDIPPDADLTDPAAYPDWFTASLRAARALCPEASVHAEVFSPLTHLLELFGYQEALMALIEAPETCRRLLERFTAMAEAQVECLAPHGPDAVLISSAFAGAGFISRAMYEQFVAPYEQRLAAAVHRHALPVYVHTCGAIGDRLDLMSRSGIDGIDTLDPPPLGTVELADAKRRFGDRFFLKGNLDAVNEMLHADDAAFDRAVLDRLQTGMPGGGYILSSACSVAPHVRPDRLRRMVSLAEAHGRYGQ